MSLGCCSSARTRCYPGEPDPSPYSVAMSHLEGVLDERNSISGRTNQHNHDSSCRRISSQELPISKGFSDLLAKPQSLPGPAEE